MLCFFENSVGFIKVSGNDALDFFNRMSTNDLSTLPANTYKKTVFTTDKGRIIDIVTLLNHNNGMSMIISPGYEEKVIEHLDKFIIMDDVVLEKQSGHSSLILFGDDILQNVNTTLGIDIKNDGSFNTIDDAYIFFDDFQYDKVVIIGETDKIINLKQRFSGFKEMSENEYELFRIDEAIPIAPNEINEQINPVECGFSMYISFTKGCYIGQEVIARLDSQGKIPKQMVKLSSLNVISPEDRIFSDGKEVGFISSTLNDKDNYKGLGFIRSVNLDYNKEYTAGNEKGDNSIRISQAIL